MKSDVVKIFKHGTQGSRLRKVNAYMRSREDVIPLYTGFQWIP